MAEIAFSRIEEMIVTLQLKPGQIISENELSEHLGIGRMPVREAIKLLEIAHLVVVMPRKGVIVKEIKSEDTFLQLEVRRALEELIVWRATKFSTPDEKEKFLEMANAYEKATEERNDIEAVRIDHEFNQFLSKCARNRFASAAIAPIYALGRRIYFYQYKKNEVLTKEINLAHVKLMRAIASGDEDLSKKALNDLLNSTVKLHYSFLEVWYPNVFNRESGLNE